MRAYQNAGQLLDAVWAVMNFQVENFDTDAYHSNVTDTSRLTVPAGKAGYYHIIGTVTLASVSNNAGARILLNGSQTLGINYSASNGNTLRAATVNAFYYLNAGDYVELMASGNAVNSSGDLNTHFGMYMIQIESFDS